jgi:hypothetical protein
MGIIFEEAAFEGKAPSPKQIAEKLEEIAGLPIILNEFSQDDCGPLHDFYAHIAFARFPKFEIELHAYRPGAVAKFLQESKLDNLPMTKVMTGANEPPGIQTVHLEWHIGLEPTLFYATLFSLESLGGRLQGSIPEYLRREFGGRISEDELDRRWRKTRTKGLLRLAVGIVLLPVAIPCWIISFIWQIILLPWRLLKAYRLYKQM